MIESRTAFLSTLGLILIALAVVIGVLYLTANGKPVPGSLIAIGSAAVGALGTTFVGRRSPGNGGNGDPR